jgi:hypothetical protein
MLAEVERRVLAAGWSSVSLKVATEAIDAQRFYRRNGFAQTSRDGDYLVFLKELAGAADVPT